ncbi:hypothetical protein [Streptacidiphilus cavernicola]|uniref:Uncharacterized protein n=1 Tax=Streptacidiphilus cavernicola TaxID=3342716 RepID=A0ABV6VY87_9ACTN
MTPDLAATTVAYEITDLVARAIAALGAEPDRQPQYATGRRAQLDAYDMAVQLGACDPALPSWVAWYAGRIEQGARRGHLLAAAGRWEEAVSVMGGTRQYAADLLAAMQRQGML